jgi:predicted alpha/beta hydrolase
MFVEMSAKGLSSVFAGLGRARVDFRRGWRSYCKHGEVHFFKDT